MTTISPSTERSRRYYYYILPEPRTERTFLPTYLMPALLFSSLFRSSIFLSLPFLSFPSSLPPPPPPLPPDPMVSLFVFSCPFHHFTGAVRVCTAVNREKRSLGFERDPIADDLRAAATGRARVNVRFDSTPGHWRARKFDLKSCRGEFSPSVAFRCTGRINQK